MSDNESASIIRLTPAKLDVRGVSTPSFLNYSQHIRDLHSELRLTADTVLPVKFIASRISQRAVPLQATRPPRFPTLVAKN